MYLGRAISVAQFGDFQIQVQIVFYQLEPIACSTVVSLCHDSSGGITARGCQTKSHTSKFSFFLFPNWNKEKLAQTHLEG